MTIVRRAAFITGAARVVIDRQPAPFVDTCDGSRVAHRISQIAAGPKRAVTVFAGGNQRGGASWERQRPDCHDKCEDQVQPVHNCDSKRRPAGRQGRSASWTPLAGDAAVPLGVGEDSGWPLSRRAGPAGRPGCRLPRGPCQGERGAYTLAARTCKGKRPTCKFALPFCEMERPTCQMELPTCKMALPTYKFVLQFSQMMLPFRQMELRTYKMELPFRQMEARTYKMEAPTCKFKDSRRSISAPDAHRAILAIGPTHRRLHDAIADSVRGGARL